jgi:DNA polymerase IV
VVAQRWRKIIVHADMDAYFAQIEQRDFPQLRGKPVAVTNGEKGSCIITRSYEARAYGVKTGMRWYEARRLCPGLVRQPSRPGVYAALSSRIMEVLATVSPDIEIFSVDEAFLDLSHCRGLYQSAGEVARLIRERVWAATGLTCSVGISGDKTTAKIASKRGKPNGYFIIPPWQAKAALAPLPVTDLCGINRGVAQFLAQYGVYYCGQMATIPINVLAKRFGNIGRRLWKMCQGEDPEPVKLTIAAPKSIGHGKVMPPATTDQTVILTYLAHMAEKVAQRMRRHQLVAQRFFIGLKTAEGWLAKDYRAVQPTQDGLLIYQFAKALLLQHWQGEPVFQCQITALRPQTGSGQLDLFAPRPLARQRINGVVDQINDRFGQGALKQATRLQALQMPEVIAPAWRPTGHRASVNSDAVDRTKDRY